ncbi:hypothetical protein N7470_000854 [Penicillium chermesinum]|nr:hypothetical protein N7470_000854 [Penicillium chermesinum]
MQAHLPEPVWMPAGQSHGPQVPRVWKLASNCASVGLLLGYLMLAVVFGGSSDDLHINAAAAAVVAYGFIGISYAVSVGISFCQRSAQGFLLRSIFMPYLIINLIALFNVVFNIIARDLRPLNAARVIAIGLPATGVLVYGLVAFLIYRELEPEGSHLPDEEAAACCCWTMLKASDNILRDCWKREMPRLLARACSEHLSTGSPDSGAHSGRPSVILDLDDILALHHWWSMATLMAK